MTEVQETVSTGTRFFIRNLQSWRHWLCERRVRILQSRN